MCLLTRLSSFRLPLVCINGPHTCWTVLYSIQRYKKWLCEWFLAKGDFTGGIHKLPERWKKMYNKRWRYFYIWYARYVRKVSNFLNYNFFFIFCFYLFFIFLIILFFIFSIFSVFSFPNFFIVIFSYISIFHFFQLLIF